VHHRRRPGKGRRGRDPNATRCYASSCRPAAVALRRRGARLVGMGHRSSPNLLPRDGHESAAIEDHHDAAPVTDCYPGASVHCVDIEGSLTAKIPFLKIVPRRANGRIGRNRIRHRPAADGESGGGRGVSAASAVRRTVFSGHALFDGADPLTSSTSRAAVEAVWSPGPAQSVTLARGLGRRDQRC